MTYEVLLVLAIALVAFLAVLPRRKYSSWRDMLESKLYVLALGAYLGAIVLLRSDRVLLGSALLISSLLVTARRSRMLHAARWASMALPHAAPNDSTEVILRETDLADVAEKQRAYRRGMMLRSVVPGAALLGTGAFLGSGVWALVGAVCVVAVPLWARFVLGPVQPSALPPDETPSDSIESATTAERLENE